MSQISVFSVLLLPLFIYPAPSHSFKILQISDFHYDSDYSTAGDTGKSCHGAAAASRAARLGIYGDYKCDSPGKLVSFAIQEARRIFPEPDLLVWTGDNVPHINGYDMSYVHRALNFTTSELFAAFPNVKAILPTFGNHDYAPADQFEIKSSLYAYMYEMWKEHMDPDGENEQRFKRGGYYKHLLPSATVLVLNTNLYYLPNKAYDNFTDKEDPAGQFEFIESELLAAKDCAKKDDKTCRRLVHMAAHIAPGVFERTANFTWLHPEYNKKLVQLIATYADVIGWLIFGHHHTDTFHIIRNAAGEPVQLLLLAPAVTPWLSTLPGAGANNPAFRVYDVDEPSGAYKSISTYSVSLAELNGGGEASFKLEYEMREAYNLREGINARSMDNLIDRMRKNDELFMTYVTFNSVGWEPKKPEGIFRAGQFCSLSHADLAAYYSCLEEETSSVAGAFHLFHSLIFLLASLLLSAYQQRHS